MNHVCQNNDKQKNFFNFKIWSFFIVMTEDERLIAELGKPRLGDKSIIRIRIRESKEFKV